MALGATLLGGCASIVGVDDVSLWDAGTLDAGSKDGSMQGSDDATTNADGSDSANDTVADEGEGSADRADSETETSPSDEGGNLSMDAGPDSDGSPVDAAPVVDACVRSSQAAACPNFNCSTVDDPCGNTISCGTCPAPETCGTGSANLCWLVEAGCSPKARYTVLDTGNGANGSGSGLVHDSTTGLTWMRFYYTPASSTQAEDQADAYCQSVGMRLPTESEALAISGANGDACAWPQGWDTWTSSTASGGFGWYDIGAGGQVNVGYVTNYNDVICVTGN